MIRSRWKIKIYIDIPVLEILESWRPVLWNKRSSPVISVRNVRIGNLFTA